MNGIIVLSIALAWLAIFMGGCLGWQLLRQNGRMLLRLDELEKRLNELEFAGTAEPECLPLGSDAPPLELPDVSGEPRSLAQFRGQTVLLVFFNPGCGFCREMVPKLAPLIRVRRPGKRDAALDVDANIVHPSQSAGAAGAVQNDGGLSSGEQPVVLIVSTGDAEANRHLFDEHKVSCLVLLQKDGEMARAYQPTARPAVT
jgi:hypothetical protein